MKFVVVPNLSVVIKEMTTTLGIGLGTQVALGGIPQSRKYANRYRRENKRKKVKKGLQQ